MTDQELIYLPGLLLIKMITAPRLLSMFGSTPTSHTSDPILRDGHCHLLYLEELSQILRVPHYPALAHQYRGRLLLLLGERVRGCQQVLLVLS